MKETYVFLRSCLLAAGMLLTSCSNPESDFKQAEQANTEQAYAEFIVKHPQSPLVAEAKTKMEQAAWESGRKTASVAGYEGFLKQYQSGAHAGEARAELASLEFATASKAATIESWQAFLNKHAGATNALAAKDELARLVLEQVDRTNTVEAYEVFGQQFAGTRAAKLAGDRAEALDYAAATNENSIASYESFLAKYRASESQLIRDARARIGRQVEERDWGKAALENTPDGYATYHAAHPNGERLQLVDGVLENKTMMVSYGQHAAYSMRAFELAIIESFQRRQFMTLTITKTYPLRVRFMEGDGDGSFESTKTVGAQAVAVSLLCKTDGSMKLAAPNAMPGQMISSWSISEGGYSIAGTFRIGGHKVQFQKGGACVYPSERADASFGLFLSSSAAAKSGEIIHHVLFEEGTTFTFDGAAFTYRGGSWKAESK